MKPFVGSYSRIKMSQDCPKKFYHLEIVKDVMHDPMGEANSEGVRGHRRLQLCIESGLDAPHSMKYMQWALDYVRKQIEYADPKTYRGMKSSVACELKFGLDRRMASIGFFGEGVKFRGIADLLVVNGTHGYVVDYKFGKAGYADPNQLDYMALCIFLDNPSIQTVEGQLLFIKHPLELMHREQYTREDLPFLQKQLAQWFVDVRDRKVADNWPAIQSGLCKNYCPVTKDKCKHSGRV